jgi:NAD(P)-dependent dehydrogenase (short-subunit alcohol dehydrogenase family)
VVPLFPGKVAIVTGGSSGIGRAAAIRFAEEGASVLIADLDEVNGMDVVAQIKQSGGTGSFLRTDVTKAADNEAMVDCALERYGRLDAALNNAGMSGRFTNVVSCAEGEWHSVMDVNAKSVWLAMKYEIPAMRRGGGAIVNTSSASTQRIQRGMASYIASKYAVIGLTKSAAIDFAADNIRVCALLAGVTLTPMLERGLAGIGMTPEQLQVAMPLRRLGKPEEQAEAALWLCSPHASFITGIAMCVDGGETL